ncbi:MAG: hypothetical protein ACOVQT_10680, partial [Rubrivivax sp.]
MVPGISRRSTMAAVMASTMRCVDVPAVEALAVEAPAVEVLALELGLSAPAVRGAATARGDRGDRVPAALAEARGDGATEAGGRGILASTDGG